MSRGDLRWPGKMVDELGEQRRGWLDGAKLKSLQERLTEQIAGVAPVRERRRPNTWDVALAAFLFLADLSEMRFLHSLYWPEGEIAAWPVVVLIVTVRAAALAFRRRYPLVVTLLVSATIITIPTNGFSYLISSYYPALSPAFGGDPGWWPTALGWTSFLEALIALYTVTAVRGRRSGTVAALWFLVCTSPWLTPQVVTYGPAAALLNPLTVGIAVYLGDVRRRILIVSAEVAERSERIAKNRRQRANDAARDERERLSSELQALVSRHLHQMVGQARTAREVVATLGGSTGAREAIKAIELTGRAALAEARRALGLLRDEAAPAPLTPGRAPTPMPAVTGSDGAEGSLPPGSSGVSGPRLTRWDLLFAFLLLTFFVSEIGTSESLPPWRAIERAGHPEDIVSILLVTVPVAFRRWLPLPAALLVCGGFALHATAGHFFGLAGIIALLVAIYSVWAERGTRQGLVALAVAAAVVPVAREQLVAVFQFGLITMYVPYLPAAAFLGWQERRLALVLDVRRAQEKELRLLAEAELDRARREERLRIARDLHDVTAHSLSVMTIQAGAARTVAADQPEEARSALANVEETGRRAQAALQKVFAAGGFGPPDDSTQRLGIDAIPALVDGMTAAGLTVELDVSGPAQTLSPGLDLSIYRVVQEALTNTAKHAGATHVRVRVTCDADTLMLEIDDEGTRSTTPPVEVPMEGGGGRGLIGMRERVGAYGGTLTAAERGVAGFSISVSIPLTPDVTTAGKSYR